MAEKFSVEQKAQIVIESFTVTNTTNWAEGMWYPFNSSTPGKKDFSMREAMHLEKPQREMNTRRRLMI